MEYRIDTENDSAEGRYRALLKVSTLLPAEPDFNAVLHSVSVLLSTIVRFDRSVLMLLNDSGESATLYAAETKSDVPNPKLGEEFLLKGTVFWDAVDTQKPVYIERLRDELAKYPQFAQNNPVNPNAGSYVFPLSSSRRRLGLLIFVSENAQKFGPADIELLNSVTAHVSTLLESALALESAERYRRDLEVERDRLKLLLEINNHTIAHRDIAALFRAASTSIRSFFDNPFTAFWIFEEGTSRLLRVYLDSPVQGLPEMIEPPLLNEEDLARMRARVPYVLGPDWIDALPDSISKTLRRAGIASLATVPLVGSRGTLGAMSVAMRERDAFAQDDMNLLAQVANQIALALDNALAYGRVEFSYNRLKDEKLYLESELQIEYNFADIVGNSPALREVLDQVSIVAPTNSTILLIGETGTGKELIARAIHNRSSRKDRAFVRLNCAAVPSGLMESELFGHEKGAFTGALIQKRGRIELADEGTFFLDEIGDIGLDLQPKLLRVLQEREFERLGSNRTLKVDIRLIAATHRNLPDMVRNGDFRDDLFYRLNVFPIHIPPLRERREDIPLLVHYFVATLSRKMRKSIRIIPREVMEAMTAFAWPGNVRELQNFIERSVILSRGETLAAPISELNRALIPETASGTTLHGMERDAILNALRAAQGKLSGPGGAAESLGLKRTTLQRKMERLGITKSDYL